MMEWYQCEWCEGDGGWHSEIKPSYTDPGADIGTLRRSLMDLKEIISRRHDSGELVDGGDLRYWIELIDFALASPPQSKQDD